MPLTVSNTRRPPLIFRKPERKRPLRGKRVTVGIAAACNAGELVVTATDGALSQGGESMDLALAKMYWFASRDTSWQFMYAGEPGNADLILENIREALGANKNAVNRETIQKTLRRAYKKRFAEWTADYVLAPYDLTMEEFKKEGRKMFGDDFAAKLARDMNEGASAFAEELMVVGWGRTPNSVMIYGMNQSGAWSGSLVGLGTIGAGREVAMSTLLLHGITRYSTLEDTIYAVAAAKFSAERCDGVGKNTTICVGRKPRPSDGSTAKVHEFLRSAEIGALRAVWEDYGRIRIPNEGAMTMMQIAQRVSGGVSAESIVRLVHATRNPRRSAPRKSADQR